MSDEYDETGQNLVISLVSVYRIIRKVCGRLPLPIELPDGPVYDGELTMQAVGRTVFILQDAPVDEEIRKDLTTACLMWLAASKVIMWYLRFPDDPTAEIEATHLMVAAGEAAIDAGSALLESETDD
ncbi:hypothetical protein [Streptomyces sp. NPDC048659]|uniref:hypothetical protein n=1 Tax=Streptomyces sp. NPDC048659 TaxID=3155489 RepID=UPI00343CAC85